MNRSFSSWTCLILLSTTTSAQCFGQWDAGDTTTSALEKPLYEANEIQAQEVSLPLDLSISSKPHYRKRYHIKEPSEDFGLFAVTTGVWIPTGWNQILGAHPTLGFAVGGWHNRTLIELNMEFRFVEAAHHYTVIYEGDPLSVNHYFGGFIGMHLGYCFMNIGNSSYYGLLGIGYDGFDAVDGNEDHPSKSINAFGTNVGVGYQYFKKDGRTFGIELTYNLADYNNAGGTPLVGNAFNIRLLFGMTQ